MGRFHWTVLSCERRVRGTLLIYEGEISDLRGKERISFHFTIREDTFVVDILAETTGGFRFIEYLKETFGEPEDEPLSIFHGEFGDGVPALPISAWWRVDRNIATSIIDHIMKKEE